MGGDKILGTGGGLAYRKETPPPVSRREGDQGTQAAGDLADGGGWKERVSLRTSPLCPSSGGASRPLARSMGL